MKNSLNIIIIAIIALLVMFLFTNSGTQENRDLGVGPIKSLKLGPINKGQVSMGQNIFNSKCFVCHTLDQKKVGPPLGKVAKEQAPEYIVNLLLNTVEMQQKDSRVKQLLYQYKVPMPDLKLSKNDALSVLEYLRSASENR
ncbi:MAG: cytochrome c [Bacteroidetes bacterium]|nr:MAG: cytochrome c [Bacteroidota bacterium]